jgi:hypothetical protein
LSIKKRQLTLPRRQREQRNPRWRSLDPFLPSGELGELLELERELMVPVAAC